MSLSMEEGPLKEAAILTRAVENVFRKLIRLLIGRMSLTRLQELIRIIFVEEATAKLELEDLGGTVSLSRLGLLTGLDTRTLKKVRRTVAEKSLLTKDEELLDGFNPLLRVIDLWLSDERFFDFNRSRPKGLKIDAEAESNGFSDLIKDSMPARGITVRAFLQRLKQSGMVHEDTENNKIELLTEESIFVSKDEMEMIEIGMEATSNLLGTITRNIGSRRNADLNFFQRGFWNYQLDRKKMEEIRKIIHSFLLETDKKGRELITSLAEPEINDGQITAGVGLFYFEKDMSS